MFPSDFLLVGLEALLGLAGLCLLSALDPRKGQAFLLALLHRLGLVLPDLPCLPSAPVGRYHL